VVLKGSAIATNYELLQSAVSRPAGEAKGEQSVTDNNEME
jgi:hypothetical protein